METSGDGGKPLADANNSCISGVKLSQAMATCFTPLKRFAVQRSSTSFAAEPLSTKVAFRVASFSGVRPKGRATAARADRPLAIARVRASFAGVAI